MGNNIGQQPAKTIMVLEELNLAYIQQSVVDHVRIAELEQLNKELLQNSINDLRKLTELSFENKRLKTELRDIRLIKAICNGED